MTTNTLPQRVLRAGQQRECQQHQQQQLHQQTPETRPHPLQKRRDPLRPSGSSQKRQAKEELPLILGRRAPRHAHEEARALRLRRAPAAVERRHDARCRARGASPFGRRRRQGLHHRPRYPHHAARRGHPQCHRGREGPLAGRGWEGGRVGAVKRGYSLSLYISSSSTHPSLALYLYLGRRGTLRVLLFCDLRFAICDLILGLFFLFCCVHLLESESDTTPTQSHRSVRLSAKRKTGHGDDFNAMILLMILTTYKPVLFPAVLLKDGIFFLEAWWG